MTRTVHFLKTDLETPCGYTLLSSQQSHMAPCWSIYIEKVTCLTCLRFYVRPGPYNPPLRTR